MANYYAYAYVDANPITKIDLFGLAGQPSDLGIGYTARSIVLTRAEGPAFEIHVFDPSGAEVGVYGADGRIDTHGFTEPPKLPDNISNSLKGHVVQELRGRGAKAPADRRRLVAELALMPLTIEEFLRAYAPVTMAREVVKDTTIGGCPIKPGNMLLLSVPAANRDPAMCPDADKVIVDRKENRHAAFGLGIHRCVGSNLARMEMTVAVEEFLKRIPEFCLDLSQAVTRSEGTVRGPRNLPLIIG